MLVSSLCETSLVSQWASVHMTKPPWQLMLVLDVSGEVGRFAEGQRRKCLWRQNYLLTPSHVHSGLKWPALEACSDTQQIRVVLGLKQKASYLVYQPNLFWKHIFFFHMHLINKLGWVDQILSLGKFT